MSLDLKEELAIFSRYNFHAYVGCSVWNVAFGEVNVNSDFRMHLYLLPAVQSLYQESASFYLSLKKNIYNSLTVN